MAAVALTVSAFAIISHRLPPIEMSRGHAVSMSVVDRNDRLLRAFTTQDGRWRLPVSAKDVDPRYLDMLLAFEDRRFHSHHGVDPIAMVRAAAQALRHRRLVSGGSTITMQVARLVTGEHERTATGKLRQMLRAFQLERRHTKPEILDLYLRLTPFGGNVEGIRAASLAYFGKEPRRLTAAEAALLVALPQAPEVRRPDRHSVAARRGRDRVLRTALARGIISRADYQEALAEPVPERRREFPKLAPHLAEAEIKRAPDQAVHRTSLDAEVQARLEKLARESAHAAGPHLSTAIVAADHRTGEILAHVGSADYFDATRYGAIDMTRAIRSPGSTLKPFIYGLGFEAGVIHPETLIEDTPTRFGAYAPKNFDEDFHGTVTIREALARSLNIPAVKVLSVVGPGRLTGRLRRGGAHPRLPQGANEATLAIALGGVGLDLFDLVGLYTGLARGGMPVALTTKAGVSRPSVSVQDRRRQMLLTPAAAWYVTDILKDAPAPAGAKSGAIAYKTGTSYGHRDAWAIGYDGRHTIAVWVGRPDGAATPELSGRTAAAPILFDAFARLAPARAPFATAPPSVIRVSGSDLPQPLKRFAEPDVENVAGPFVEPPVAIAFPPDRSEIETDRGFIQLKAEGGVLPLTWLADGAPLPLDGSRREIDWQPDGQGFVRLSVVDARGRVDRVTVRVR
jgi:penicillin-binding protein 1C